MTSHKSKYIKIYGIETPDFQQQTTELLNKMRVQVNEVAVARHSDGLYDYTFYCEMPGNVVEEEIIKLFENKCTVDTTRLYIIQKSRFVILTRRKKDAIIHLDS